MAFLKIVMLVKTHMRTWSSEPEPEPEPPEPVHFARSRSRSWSPRTVLLGAGAGAGAEMLPRSRSWSRSRPKMSRLRIPGRNAKCRFGTYLLVFSWYTNFLVPYRMTSLELLPFSDFPCCLPNWAVNCWRYIYSPLRMPPGGSAHQLMLEPRWAGEAAGLGSADCRPGFASVPAKSVHAAPSQEKTLNYSPAVPQESSHSSSRAATFTGYTKPVARKFC